MKQLLLAAFFVALAGRLALAEPVRVSLADYAFDFTTIGYEIEITGTTANLMESLSSGGHISISDDDYSIKAVVDGLGRRGRKEFIDFFNAHCIGFTARCPITASGEIELGGSMQMVLRINEATIEAGGNSWSSAEGGQ